LSGGLEEVTGGRYADGGCEIGDCGVDILEGDSTKVEVGMKLAHVTLSNILVSRILFVCFL
jgi:hypothetical protein